jgi:hypothetical protein
MHVQSGVELLQINPKYSPDHTLRILPYRDRAPLDQFVAGLSKAGLQSGGWVVSAFVEARG